MGSYDEINNEDKLEQIIQKVKTAQKVYAEFSQAQVDEIFRTCAIAANKMRIPLAKIAVEETGMGIVEDKIIKNHFACEYIYNKHRNTKTCGIIKEDNINGINIIAEPLGVIAGIIPTTNPTSTAIFKTLISLKTRNGIIFSPHPRAKKCTVEAVKIILEAAIEAGAPKNIIGWIDNPTIELTKYLMEHPAIDCILATGGTGMVKSAYSSGKPALGVGSGNVPAIIDETADINCAVSSILLSKTFDNGLICASEQSVIVHQYIYDKVKKEFEICGAYFLSPEEEKKISEIILDKEYNVNSAIVGQSAYAIAKIAGINVPEKIKVLVGEEENTEITNPFAHEKLSPILAMYRAKNYEHSLEIALSLVKNGGMGHTAVLHIDEQDKNKINMFSSKIPAGRLLINSPASQGAIGDLYNFKLEPSLTLGCGSWGKNSVSENISVMNLLNFKTVAYRRENMLWFKVPPKIYFKRGSIEFAIKELKGKKRAFIVTDNYLFKSGEADKITKILSEIGCDYEIFFDVLPDPNLSMVEKAMISVKSYEPDLIIALGGGSPIDTAKIIWLMYEQPDTKFEEISMRFMDIRKRICAIPELGKKAIFVAIPTTSGTGAEITPFSIITDDKTGIKFAIADYALTPNIAIIDPDFTDKMPAKLTASSGIDALVHAIEAYVSVMANEFTDAYALQAVNLIFKYLKRAYKNGNNDTEAREQMHYTATIAGMAFANSFLGLCHSMAHKMGALFHIPHGIANALLIRQIIKYNATDNPQKQCAFPQYKYPNAKERYAQIADNLNLGGENNDEKVNFLISAIDKLMDEIDLPKSLKEYGINESEFIEKLDVMTELAFDDQCTGANPVYPLMSDIKAIYLNAFEGILQEYN